MCPLLGYRKLRWQSICDSFMNVIDILVHVRKCRQGLSIIKMKLVGIG